MDKIGKIDANTKIGGSINDLGTEKQDVLNYQGILSLKPDEQIGKPVENYGFGKIPEGLKPFACIETELKNKDKSFGIPATMAQGIMNSAKVFNRS